MNIHKNKNYFSKLKQDKLDQLVTYSSETEAMTLRNGEALGVIMKKAVRSFIGEVQLKGLL